MFSSTAIGAGKITEVTKSYIQKNAIILKDRGAIDKRVFDSLKSHLIITIGEMHGSNEIQDFTRRLAEEYCRNGTHLIVGLEIDRSNQTAIDNYMQSGDDSMLRSMPHFNTKWDDGRKSIAMASLIRSLQKLPNLRIIAFDSSDIHDAQERDSKMAQLLLEKIGSDPNARVLLLAGSVHSSAGYGSPFDAHYRPMAYELCHLQNSKIKPSDVYAIKVIFEKGQTWCMVDGNAVGPHDWRRSDTFTDSIAANSYFLPLEKLSEDGYNAVLFIRTLSASRPYIEN